MTDDNSAENLFSSLGRRLTPPRITAMMKAALETPDLLSLAAGFTDTATLPREEIREAVETLLDGTAPPECLQYGSNAGRPLLRSLLSDRVAAQDGSPGALDAEAAFVTNGSQQALSLALQTLCDPGDLVLVERPTYFVFLELARGLGMRIRSLPTRPDGNIDLDALDRTLASLTSEDRRRLKAVYLVSYFANPSSGSFPESAKTALGDVLERHGIRPALIEDAAYRDLYFETPFPSRSILTLPELERFPRLYAGTCTKPFATGLKVGFALCPDETWRNRMLSLKGQQDFGTAHFNQAILETVLLNGRYDTYLDALRRHYRNKKNTLLEVLEGEGLESLGWHWENPGGGLYLWLCGPEGLRTGQDSPFQRDALENGVLYVPGELCYGDDAPGNRVRLSFGVLPPELLREAGRRFARTARRSAGDKTS